MLLYWGISVWSRFIHIFRPFETCSCVILYCVAFVCQPFPMMQYAFWPLRSQSLVAHRIVKQENCDRQSHSCNLPLEVSYLVFAVALPSLGGCKHSKIYASLLETPRFFLIISLCDQNLHNLFSSCFGTLFAHFLVVKVV